MPNIVTESTTAAIVAAITATPPPCGVGMVCEDRALGRAIAYRASKGRSARMSNPQTITAASGIAMMLINVIVRVSYYCLTPTAHQ